MTLFFNGTTSGHKTQNSRGHKSTDIEAKSSLDKQE